MRLWPLIVGVGLFVLAGVAWHNTAARFGDYYPGPLVDPDEFVFPDHGGLHRAPSPVYLAMFVGLVGIGATVWLLTSFLVANLAANLNRDTMVWHIVTRFVPALLVSSIATLVAVGWCSDSSTRVAGVMVWIGIAGVMCIGYRRSNPIPYFMLIRLVSLPLFALSVHLALHVLQYEYLALPYHL